MLTCKIGLKIQGVHAYNFEASRSNVTKLFHATYREAGTTFGEGPPPKIWEGKKCLKFGAISDNF